MALLALAALAALMALAQAGLEVSYFASIGWKLETSGNENGNFVFSNTKMCAFIGKFDDGRKLGKSGMRKLRAFS